MSRELIINSASSNALSAMLHLQQWSIIIGALLKDQEKRIE